MKPMMPGKYDAIYDEIDLRDGYRAIAYDSDPYTEVTVLRKDVPLFTVLVGDYKVAISTIEKNIENYLQQVGD
jgi:hypothetical protein